MIIGIPKEIKVLEGRVAMTPAGVMELTRRGHTVFLQKGAGVGSNLPDERYQMAGAVILDTMEEVYAAAEMIVKVKEPLEKEYNLIRKGQILFTYFHFASNKQLTQAMADSGAVCIAYETVMDKLGALPLLTPMSEVAGRLSVQQGAKYLEKPQGGKGVLLGGVPGVNPAEVMIIGAGVAGTMAARAALALGASVKVFDDDIAKLRTIRHELGSSLFTSTLQPNVLRNVFHSADVVIGAMQYINKSHFYRISADLIREMKEGSLVIDLRMAQGGCFETTMEACLSDHPPIFEKFGVLHFCEMSL
ncbi:MAG TPA: alanine dehydrogenase, partial [Proteiniphilum sp.]|nr:alanine dehydrogenase [Proteiniphilum sp.]